MRHVDFDASYDGPVIPGAPPMSIDDLVLCEECLTLGARELGLGDVTGVEQELGQALDEARDAREALAKANETVAALRGAIAALTADTDPAVAPSPAPAADTPPAPSAQPPRHQQQRRKRQA